MGQARRLTTDDRLEFFPSFSRDGRWIVYTAWSDAEMGRVRVVRPDGSAGRDIVARPGHYVEAAFSPDGQKVVYRHAGGDRTRGPFFGEDAGVYVVPVAGGDPVLVRDSGQAPEFDHTGTRVYVREVRNEKNTLFSVGVPAGPVELPGRDEIEHVRSDNATQFAVSPDGKWIAFEERYRTRGDGPAGRRLARLHERDADPRRPHRRRALASRATSLPGRRAAVRDEQGGYTPTLLVGYGGLSGEYYWYQHSNVWENEQLLRFMPREVVDARSRRRTMAGEDDFNHVLIARSP